MTTATGAAVSAQEAPPAERSRLRLEASGGFDTPLGLAGLAVVFSATPWLSAGGGVGFMQQAGSPWLRTAIFARANVLHAGRFTLGPVVSASFGTRAREETYHRPQYVADDLRWTWAHALRLDAGFGAETRAASSVTARLEVGVGYVLATPTCTYSRRDDGGAIVAPPFRGPCDAPEIPSYYHFAPEPGRLTPYAGLTLAFEPRPLTVARRASPPAPPTPPTPPQPAPEVVAEDPRAGTAWAAPTALLQPKGSVTVTLLLASRTPLLGVTVGLLDRLDLTVAGGANVSDRPDLLWMAWLKGALVARGVAHLALVAGGAGVEPRNGNDLSGYARFGGAGPVGSLCFDAACRSLISVSVLAGVAAIRDQDAFRARMSPGALFSASLVIGLWRHLKVVAEGHAASGDVPPLWAVVLRVPFPHVSVDAGVALGVPVGSVSARF